LAGCGTVTEADIDGQTPAPFTIALDRDDVFLHQGEVAVLALSIERQDGLAEDVAVEVTGLPAGVVADPLVVAASSTAGTLVLRAAGNAAVGEVTADVGGTSESGEEGTVPLHAWIAGPPGSPDTTFAGDGTFAFKEMAQLYVGRGVAVQADGKILATGSTQTQAVVLRLLPDGTLDPSFGTDGLTKSGTGDYSQGLTVKELADGRVLAVGVANGNLTGGAPQGYDFGLHAYTSAGVLDDTFDVDGIAEYSPSDGYAELTTVAEAPNGDLYVAGSDFGINQAVVLRFSSAGVRDTTYLLTHPTSYVEASVLQPDGKFVVAGSKSSDFWLARVTGNGVLDNTFDGDGVVTTDFGGGSDAAHGVLLLPDGAILAVGIAAGQVAMARYLANGTLDTSFGTGGKAVLPIEMLCRGPNGAAVDREGRIVLVGHVENVPAVVRMLPDGRPDYSFGNGGIAVVDFNLGGKTTQSSGFGIAIDSAGRVVFGGELGPAGQQQLVVGRLWP